MKKNIVIILVSIILPLFGWSQTDSPIAIKGKSRLVVEKQGVQERTVELDSVLIDHLIVKDYRKDGWLVSSTYYKFTGREFNLGKIDKYLEERTLLRDGECREYFGDESIENLKTYREDTLASETFFDKDGRKMVLVSGGSAKMNGMFVMWYPNGKISFKGNYRNDKKNGDFQSFDEEGKLMKRGVYNCGKLIEGEPVVQDFEYANLETPAQFEKGKFGMNDYLIEKTRSWPFIKTLAAEERYGCLATLNINKLGEITGIDISEVEDSSVVQFFIRAFDDFPRFQPALIEEVGVRSIQTFSLELDTVGVSLGYPYGYSKEVTSRDSLKGDDVYFIVEQMPLFPGGEMEFRKFIAMNVRYPVYAQEKGIQGKVYVNFIVEKDGRVREVKIVKGVHATLNEEALRVIRKSPIWKPGIQRGKPVRVSFTVPVSFVLQ